MNKVMLNIVIVTASILAVSVLDVSAEPPNCLGTINGIKFIRIQGGSFRMGSEGYGADEVPVHELTVGSFCMSTTEITQRQLLEVTGKLPWSGSWVPPPRTRDDSLRVARLDSIRAALEASGSDRLEKYVPGAAVWISWNGAVEFCNKLSSLAGREPCYDLETWNCDFSKNGFRLPTEAEWEYACRAGTVTAYFTGNERDGLSEVAWFGQKTEGYEQRLVGLKKANSFGLYDMHGNVWEWCNDWYLPGYYTVSPNNNPPGPDNSGPGQLRVNRGGSRSSGPLACRSATRRGNPPSARNSTIGFRIVCRP
jgi:formylglycine-generating enzyme required for sulfatase activity